MSDLLKLNENKPLSALVDPLIGWYRQNQRILPWRENRDPYRIWISEIMLQQTRVDTVIPYYMRFLSAFPTVRALADADDDELMKRWEGLGYYSRAKNLKRAAQMICERFGGEFPQDPADVRTLPGIGPYTVGAICSIAFGQPTPAVDGNVLRVISRLCRYGGSIDAPETKNTVTAALEAIYPAAEACGDFTQSLMELGAIVCLPNGSPLCQKCPLAGLCAAHARGDELAFPVQAPKPERKKETYTVLLIRNGGKIALNKRPDGGLLAGLWEFPNLCGERTPQEVTDWLKARGLAVSSVRQAAAKKHIFTHIEWKLPRYTVECTGESADFCWVTPEQLADEYPLPTAFRKCFGTKEIS